MTYDSWKTRSPDDGQPDMARCHRCNALVGGIEDEYGEFICEDCEQNAAEAAWERHCEAFHDGGATQFRSLRDQQIDAMKVK